MYRTHSGIVENYDSKKEFRVRRMLPACSRAIFVRIFTP